MKYLQKRLVSERDLRHYSERYYQVILVRLDKEFLKQREVYGFFDGQGEMIAGYMINRTPPFRILKLIPADRDEGRNFVAAHEGEFSELIAMWKTSRSKFFHALFYLQLMATILRCRSKWLLGAAVRRHAHELYLKFLPHVIYTGELDLEFQRSGGTGNETYAWVQYGSIRGMRRRFGIDGGEFLAQQCCLKLLPRAVMRGGLAPLGKKIQAALGWAFYPLASAVFLFAEGFFWVHSHWQERSLGNEDYPLSSNGKEKET